MIPVSTAENIFGKNLFFVSTFLDKYINMSQIEVQNFDSKFHFVLKTSRMNLNFMQKSIEMNLNFMHNEFG